MTTPTATTTLINSDIIKMLTQFIWKRPGFESGNYSDAASYRADMRLATRQKNDAVTLLNHCEKWCELEDWRYVLSGAERLSIAPINGRWAVEYTAGQYYPIEYRGAVARAAATALSSALRRNGMTPKNYAKTEFQRGLANRYWG